MTTSTSQADEVVAAVNNANLNAVARSAGLEGATVGTPTVTVEDPFQTEDSPFPVVVVVASVVGGLFGLSLFAAGIFYVSRVRSADSLSVKDEQERLSEKLAATQSIEERLTAAEAPAALVEEQEEDTAGDTDFNRDIQLLESTGPDVSRLLQGLRRSRDLPRFIETRSDAVVPGQFQPALDQEEVESR